MQHIAQARDRALVAGLEPFIEALADSVKLRALSHPY